MNAEQTTATTSQLMREALDAAMKLVAEMQDALEDYDHDLEVGEPVDLDNVGWMRDRVSDLERAAKGFRAYTLE